MDFQEYEQTVRSIDAHSAAYRELNRVFIRYNNRLFTFSEIFNLFYCNTAFSTGKFKPLKITACLSPAIAYLGTYLHKHGLTFDYVNSFQDEKDELAKKLSRDNILVIAVITTLYINIYPIVDIIGFIKEHNSSAAIIIGGPFINVQCRTREQEELQGVLQSMAGADIFVNSSQGEATLVKIIKYLENNLPLEQINNIYYKNHNEYISTPILAENNKLSENMVNWDLFSHKHEDYVLTRTSASCPFSCSYCQYPEIAGKYQKLEVEDIKKELLQLHRLNHVKSIYFLDDTLNVPVKRFKDMLRMMIANRFGFEWNSFLRCQYVDREMAELMKESGCRGVFIGFESGNDQILENMNKGARVKEYLAGLALLKEYGIITYGSFIVGFPGETDETFEDTLQFIKESGLDFYCANLWNYSHFTPIREKREAYNLKGIHYDWSHTTMDSRKAAALLDKLFLAVTDPVWVPQYNSDIDGVYRLINQGMSIQQVKTILKAFNNGVKAKLINPSQKETSPKIIKEIIQFCQEDHPPGQSFHQTQTKKEKLNAEFDF